MLTRLRQRTERGALEILSDTPEAFDRKRHALGIVSRAMEEGIVLRFG